MRVLHIEPSQLKGSVRIPSSKSHTLRALLFAALAEGSSSIKAPLSSPDTQAMIKALRLMGADVTLEEEGVQVVGCGGKLQGAEDVIDCGNSGQVLRFVGALGGLMPTYTILTGDDSIRRRRVVAPLIEALRQLGAFAVSSRGDGYAPIIVKGPFTKGRATVEGQDSQPVSALLMAAAFAPFPVEIEVIRPGERPWVNLTLEWLKRLGIRYRIEEGERPLYQLEGSSSILGFHYEVPGDFSSAAFPLAAALVTDSSLTLHNIDMDDTQGDKALIFLLQHMGARFVIDKKEKSLTVLKGSRLKGRRIDVNDFIDALPILAVIGCFAEGKTELVNGAIARQKESDRISSIACELQKMGANIEEHEDGLTIYPSQLRGSELRSYQDHRLVLSLSVAALGAVGKSAILDATCFEKTYPTFVEDLYALGGKLWM